MKNNNPWRQDVVDVYGGIALAFAIFGPPKLFPQYATMWWHFLIVLTVFLIICLMIRKSRKTKTKKHHQDATLI